ncbi:MAG: hypothetical protein M3Y41_09620, partial [Pseudomonadota bacterium]|nr:hypothetical protein [Pseudomonadota bacterium]
MVIALLAPAALGAWPGSNGRIVFEDSEGAPPSMCPPSCGASDLYTVSPGHPIPIDGQPVGVRAACGEASDCEPAWSPDGQTLAYDASYYASPDSSQVIERVGVTRLGQPTRFLAPLRTEARSSDLAPAFAPDGRRVVLSLDGQLLIDRIDGKRVRRVSLRGLRGGRASSPAWSRRGLIAFVHSGNIYVVYPGGRGMRRLTDRGGADPTFSPDGAEIAFTRGGRIYRIRVAGGAPRRFPGLARICPCAMPAWSPDGGSIAFVTNTGESNAGFSNSLYTIRVDGRHPVRLYTAGQYGTVSGPDWQPPGPCALLGFQLFRYRDGRIGVGRQQSSGLE